jgi:hypothetical protein
MSSVDLTPNETLSDLDVIKKAIVTIQNDIAEIKQYLEPFSQKEAQVNGHIEVIQRLIHQSLRTEPEQGFIGSEAFRDDSNPAEKGAEKKTVELKKTKSNTGKKKEKIKSIQFKKYNDQTVLVYGNTYDNRLHIKDCGGQWEKSESGWVMPAQNLDNLIQLFKQHRVDYLHNPNELTFELSTNNSSLNNDPFRDD